jgi:hypothetical protein
MPDGTTPALRRPIGPAIRRTDEQRARAAEVDSPDISAARMLWHRSAPPGWAGLIEASPRREES